MITDITILVLLICFIASGWRKGVFRTLLGPISLILGCFIAYLYYQKTKSLAISLSICFFGPIIIKFIATLILKISKRITRDKIPLSLHSQLAGGFLNMAWGGAYIALMLAIMGLTPKGLPWLDPIRKDIFASKSHYLLRSALDKKAPAITDEIEKLSALFENPSLMKQFQSTEEFQELSNDDSILELLEDDELVRQLEEKDYGKLMANPKFQSLLNNEDLLKKVFAFNRKIIEEDINTSLGDMKKESSPKYIKVE